MAPQFIGLIVGGIFGLAIGSLVGAVILRAAISAANKVLGPQSPSGGYSPDVETATLASSQPTDPTNPYSAPAQTAATSEPTTKAIPEPAFGKAIGMAAVIGIVGFIINRVMGILGQSSPALSLACSVVALGLNFLVASLVFTKILPTTFARAVLVYVMYLLIVIAIVAVVAGLAFVVMGLTFPR